MHLIATYLFVFVDWAFKTSEKVPSPFLLMSLYSVKEEINLACLIMMTFK